MAFASDSSHRTNSFVIPTAFLSEGARCNIREPLSVWRLRRSSIAKIPVLKSSPHYAALRRYRKYFDLLVTVSWISFQIRPLVRSILFTARRLQRAFFLQGGIFCSRPTTSFSIDIGLMAAPDNEKTRGRRRNICATMCTQGTLIESPTTPLKIRARFCAIWLLPKNLREVYRIPP